LSHLLQIKNISKTYPNINTAKQRFKSLLSILANKKINGIEVLNNINLSIAKKETYFGFNYNGFIKVPKDGIYTFYLESNDGSMLFIDDQEVVENEGNHAPIEEVEEIGLKAGLHPFNVKYFQCGGGKELKVSWSGPGLKKRELKGKDLFRGN